MDEQIKEVAARIHDLREIVSMSAEELAEKLNLPVATYLQFESGQSDIPISVLYGIASACNVELSALLTGENPRLHVYAVVRKDKGISVARRKEYLYQSLGANFIHKKAEPFLVTVKPEADGTPYALNTHPGQEFNFVLHGTLKVIIDAHEVILNEGDALFFDSGYEHGMKALNAEPVQFLAIIL